MLMDVCGGGLRRENDGAKKKKKAVKVWLIRAIGGDDDATVGDWGAEGGGVGGWIV